MKSRSRLFLVVFTLAMVAGLGINVVLTHANTLKPQGISILVDTTEDTLSDDGLCSLREAILSANTNTAIGGCPAGDGRDTIKLGSYTYDLTITNVIEGNEEDSAYTGDLDITEDLVIRGNGRLSTVLNATNLYDRALHVDPGETGIKVKFYDFNIQDGRAFEDDSKGGGGVLTSGNLLLNGIGVTNSEAQRGGGVRVTHSGSLEILDSVIEGNIASEQGGGIYGDAPITLDGVKILDNRAPLGGGIFCDQVCTFQDVSVSLNETIPGLDFGGGVGGGVYIDYPSELMNVTIDDNWANKRGGGIYSQAEVSLSNVTISDNYSNNSGSGLYLADAPAHLTNVTIYGNHSPSGEWAGLFSDLDDELDLVNTIIANNSPQNCSGDFSSFGNNISDDGSCDLTHDTDLLNTAPGLGTLEDNGGKTKTHALQANSPAIDSGSDDYCPPTDQRNFPRPTDGDRDGDDRCDIGAYELVPAGVLRIEPINYNVGENVGTLNIPVIRSDGDYGTVSVYYMTSERVAPNMANRDADYIHKFGQLTWANGDSSTKYITVTVVDDLAGEDDEIFDVILADPSGGAAISGAGRKAFIVIEDNDPPPLPTATPVPDPERVSMPLVFDD